MTVSEKLDGMTIIDFVSLLLKIADVFVKAGYCFFCIKRLTYGGHYVKFPIKACLVRRHSVSLLGVFHSKTGHPALFAELARFHQLDRKTRQLVYRAAQKYASGRPALIFVEESRLRQAAEDPEFEDAAEQLNELWKSWFEG